MSEIKLRDTLRADGVDRWVMVRTERRQNLAEHSFNVAMIARYISLKSGDDLQTANKITSSALLHDIAEIYTGDIPTPTKRIFGLNVGNLGLDLNFVGQPIDCPDERTYKVVKSADYIEAISFLTESGKSKHASEVRVSIIEEYNDFAKGLGHLEPYVRNTLKEALIGGVTVLDDHVQ